mgnify:CR=1 FL=1
MFVGGTVTVNFPPDLERVEARLALGPVKHERKEVRQELGTVRQPQRDTVPGRGATIGAPEARRILLRIDAALHAGVP